MLVDAAGNYEKALGFINPFEQQNRLNYLVSLGSIYSMLEQPDKSINAYIQAVDFAPNNPEVWQIEEAIAQEFLALNDPTNALVHLQKAFISSQDDQKDRLQQMITQLGGTP